MQCPKCKWPEGDTLDITPGHCTTHIILDSTKLVVTNKLPDGSEGETITMLFGHCPNCGFNHSAIRCPECSSFRIDPCGRGGSRCTSCGYTFGAD